MTYKFFLPVLLFALLGCGNRDDIAKFRFLEKGNLAFSNREYARAINYYNEAILKDSTFVDAWNNKGLASMKTDNYDEAIFCFGRAIQFKPDYGEAILNNARANLVVKQYFAAASLVEELKKVWPDTSLVYFTAGLVYVGKNEPDSAMQAFRQASILDKTNAEALVNIGNLFYHQQEPDSAIFYLQRAIALDTNESNAYNVLAMVYASKYMYDDALKAIDAAIELNSREAYYLNNKGYILFKLNRIEDAEAIIIQGMKMDPYNAWAYRNLGLVRYRQGNLTDAIRLLAKALVMDDQIDSLYYDLALAYQDSGNRAKACETLHKAESNAQVQLMIKENCK